jgi:hypothetical protein
MTDKKIIISGAIIIFCLGWFAPTLSRNVGRVTQVREDSLEFKFINPLLFVDNAKYTYEELNPLKKKLENYIDEQVRDLKLDRASVYYRDLNSGAWTGVGEDDKYVPGSMLKVAILMAYLRIAEEYPGIVNTKLFYKKDPGNRQNYLPSRELEEGYYTVSTLLGQTIIESDNASAIALATAQREEIDKLYSSLRLLNPPTKATDYMSPRDVSRIFRSLYSSTYLLDDYSEQALEFLTRTSFNKGLVAQLDSGISVAHKFGEHTVYYAGSDRKPDYQLHDCGIIYYPKKPYFLCVMTAGKNLSNLEKTIGDLSALTYSLVKQDN